MDNVFAHRLSTLRKECGLNQRSAAMEMKISQALLSHYENGIREPGLEFVTRACDYYGVSADYLLGRTAVRDGSVMAKSRATKARASSADALVHKRRLMSSIGLIFDCFGSILNPAALQALANCMYCRLCEILTYLPVELPQATQFGQKRMQAAVNVLQQESVLQLLSAQTGKTVELKTLEKQYPERFRDLSETIEAVGQSALSRAAAMGGKT